MSSLPGGVGREGAHPCHPPVRESVTLVHDTALRTERDLAATLLDDLVRALLTAVTASR
jgi:hypothetical protein